MTVLVVVAVDQECEAVLRDVPKGTEVDVLVSGVGPVAAAAATAAALTTNSYEAVISAGVCGGLRGRSQVGQVVVAARTQPADLGCRVDDGFLTLEDMGLHQPSTVDHDRAGRWRDRLESAGVRATVGDVLTLSCMTGTDEEAQSLAARFPDAVAEAMEGWGVVWPTLGRSVITGEVRAVSNLVGKRDPSTWDLAGALDALARAFGVLLSGSLS